MKYHYGSDDSDFFGLARGITNGADTVYGRGGDDTIFGLGGNDVLIGGAGADYINGGSGSDLAVYRTSDAGVYVSLWQGLGMGGDAQGDTLIGIEHLHGSDFADTLGGDDNGNVLRGFDGNDTLKGWGGDDTLEGNDGNDVLEGGASSGRGGDGERLAFGDRLDGGSGIDTASYSTSTAGVTVDLNSGLAQGGDAADDVLVSIENLAGSQHDDDLAGDDGPNVLQGLGGKDMLKGGGGTDVLWGGAGNDTLRGGYGMDTLRGEGGNDVLDGGPGSDDLFGGDGADTFMWTLTADTTTNVIYADTVFDFDAAEGDLISLSSIDANLVAAGNQAFTFIGTAAFSGNPGEVRYYHVGDNTYIEMQIGTAADPEGVIRLIGVHVPEASWFVL
jgi:Ca2+-binding RTX toxin-like protein